MNIVKLLVVFIMALQPCYADIDVIEWDSGSSGSYSETDSQAQVDIYVTSWCPYCRKAIAYLDANGISYNKYDIEEDWDAAARKKEIAPGYSGIPLAVINGKVLKGFNKKKYAAALKSLKYR